MKRLCILTALTLTFARPATAQNVTITGANGGTIQKSRDCLRQDGSATCAVNTTATTANGQSATKQRLRVTGKGASSTTINRTAPSGETYTRTRKIVVTN
jgi:hypothetical protein